MELSSGFPGEKKKMRKKDKEKLCFCFDVMGFAVF